MKKIKKPEIIIITGLSGAGKSVAIKAIEDFGGFCVDNMPSALIERFVTLIKTSDYNRSIIALGIDVRNMGLMDKIIDVLAHIKEMNYAYKIVFLESSDSTIIKRYSESRRRHPLSGEKKGLKEAIERERKSLALLREKAEIIIDTSKISPHELKNRLKEMLFAKGLKSLKINIMSFGFKYGIPEEADMLIDTRFLPNPHYHGQLSEKDGNDNEIIEFVMKSQLTKDLISKYKDLFDFLIPNYINEGKSYLNIGIGCTGGRHRSVVMSNELSSYLKEKKYNVNVKHRDIKQ